MKTLELRIGRSDFHPADFSAGDLASLLEGLDDAIDSEYTLDMQGNEPPSGPLISLTEIWSASCHLGFTVSDTAKPSLNRVFKALQTGDLGGLLPSSQDSLCVPLNRLTQERKLEVQFVNLETREQAILPVGDHPLKRNKNRFATCHVERMVQVISAGGIRGGAKVRTIGSNGHVFRVIANREVTEQFGKLLYKTVVIQGDGQWSLPAWKLSEVRVQSVIESGSESSSLDALKELQAIHRRAFPNGVDIASLIREHRTDDDE